MTMPAYYNEIDPQKAAWLRELIREKVIADGQVDERSIKEIKPQELAGFTQCHFFAGIGVWSYALRLAGWPDDRPVWTGSCPCPSFSAAGKGGGFNDPRHLWPDWARLIGECKPATIFGEQADDAIGYGWIDLVQIDLERENYAVGKAVLGACSVGAPHIRQRLYFVAHAEAAEALARSSEVSARAGTHDANGFGISGDTGRMGESNGARSQPGNSAAARNGHGSSNVAASGAGELADANGRGFTEHWIKGTQRDGEQCSADVGLEYPDGRRSQIGRAEDIGEIRKGLFGSNNTADINAATTEPGHVNGFWRDADWILRKRWNRDDWEWCPTEPGTFPLAHGVAGRILKLRGYGDAICAPLAQAFIEAYLDLR